MTLKESDLVVEYILFTEASSPGGLRVLLALEDFSPWSCIDFAPQAHATWSCGIRPKP